MAPILRGEIRWADLNPTIGHEQSGIRPVLILSSDVFNANSGTGRPAALTSLHHKAGFPLTLSLGKTEMPKQLWVKISQIRTLSVDRITGKIGQATEEIVAQVIEGLNEILATR